MMDSEQIRQSKFAAGIGESELAIRGLIQRIEEIKEDLTVSDTPVQKPRKDVKMPNPQKLFVVHGRDDDARRALFQFLRALHLQPIEWSQAIEMTGKGSPYIGEVLDVAFETAQAVIVLMTGDEEARLCERLRGSGDSDTLELQPRANVLFEAGMALGRNTDRTIIVELGTIRAFSDIAGRHTVRLNNSAAKRHELANRLRTAGCELDNSGTDWLKEGDFGGSYG